MTLNMSNSPSSSSYRVHAEPVMNRRTGRQETVTDSNGQKHNVSLKRHNSFWDEAREDRAAKSEAAAKHPNRTAAGIQLAANKIYGDAYEAHVGRALNRDPRFTHVSDQVRLVPVKSNGTLHNAQELRALAGQSGATLRSDFVAHDGSAYKNIECKSSSTAGFTSNQNRMLDKINDDGAQVVSGRGSYYGGQHLGGVDTTVVRPGTEDRIFEQKKLTPATPPAPRPAPRPEDPIWGRR